MKVKKNKELRSRREFFKKAAKGALPILGAIVLASNPILSRAAEVSMGCVVCEGSCMSSCKGTCSGECKGTCKYDCIGGCKAGCRGSCKNSCKRSEY